MKLTNKQAHYLLTILIDSLTKNIIGYLSISHEDRLKILNDILSQQDDTLVELKDDEKKVGDD